MKSVNRPICILSFLLVLAMVLTLAGCDLFGESSNEQTTAVDSASTAVTETPQKEKLTVLKQLKDSNDYGDVTYDYNYDFEQKSLVITCKGASDDAQSYLEPFGWSLPANVLAGELPEAIPYTFGSYEKFILWAQPLLTSGHIMTFQLILYSDDSNEPFYWKTYKFTKNTEGQVTDAEVNAKDLYNEENNGNSTIKYEYNDDGTLYKVSDNSEYYSEIWEFNRDNNGVIQSITAHEKYGTVETADTFTYTLTYIYKDDGTLERIEWYEPTEYGYDITNYRFSGDSGNLVMIEDDYTRVTFNYDDSQTQLKNVVFTDLGGGGPKDYTYEYVYETVEI